jgi:hypothetical protein
MRPKLSCAAAPVESTALLSLAAHLWTPLAALDPLAPAPELRQEQEMQMRRELSKLLVWQDG